MIFVSFNRIGEPLLPFVDRVKSIKRFAYGSNAGGIDSGWGIIENDQTLQRLIAAQQRRYWLDPQLGAEDIDYHDACISDLPQGIQTIGEVLSFLREREGTRRAT